MSMSDPIADLLTRIRNAMVVKFPTVDVPASRLKEEICRVLKQEGYITDCEMLEKGVQGTLRITLKYTADEAPVIQGLQRVSKPSLRVYSGSSDIAPVRSGLGISILSTSRGVMTGKQARAEKIGGEVICQVW